VNDKALMIISADSDADKCLLIAFAPKAMNDVDCKVWAIFATVGTGGKGGGKKDSANFQVPGASNADSLVEKARRF
jgi:alanyl-tRNA synthetase